MTSISKSCGRVGLLCLVFALFTCCLVWLVWPTVRMTGYEAGDFAANSLLIQDAKSLQLLVGNYSRVGFNHPGPAVLYVLMLGELFFHDFLHLTPAVGGQILAAAIYSAAWIAAISLIIWRLTDDIRVTLVFISLFLFCSAQFEAPAFGGLWPPHLYYLPFATFTMALAVAIGGSVSSLMVLAVASGFLINGHVSFVAIVGVMLACGLLLNWGLVSTRLLPSEQSWLTREFLFRNRWKICFALGIGVIFLVPLLLETVIHPPGPVYSYIRYSGAHGGHSVADSIRFVLSYCGGWVVALPILFLFCGFIAIGKDRSEKLFPLRILLAMAAAAVATFIYAKVGIDDLGQSYLAYFFYAVPALAIATLGAMVFQRFGSYFQNPRYILSGLVVALSAGFLFGWGARVRRLPPYAGDYNSPSSYALYQELRNLNTAMALYLDGTRGWEKVWSNVVAVQAIAKRRGDEFFCIASNWQILFTLAARCSPVQLLNYQRYVVAVPPLPQSSEMVAASRDIAVYKRRAPLIERGAEFSPSKDRTAFGDLLIGGWSPVEGDFVWSAAPRATIAVVLSAGKYDLYFDVAAFVPGDNRQQVEVAMDGQVVARWTFGADQNRRRERLPVALAEQGEHLFTFSIEKPISPLSVGLSDDGRALGIALYGLQSD